MRRQEREVVQEEKIKQVMGKCKVCRIGFYDQGEIYIVPVNFGYRLKDGIWTLYIHGAKQGRKAGLFRQKPLVGFEMDCGHELLCGETACNYSFQYASIVGTGIGRIVEDAEEKVAGLKCIMTHQTGKSFAVTEAMAEAVGVFKITVEKISCKQNLPE
jgi:nitroimidazol reductase NimA-like FMN-containing flavoprotein (pyridoxamine 5'-phosphate oxidase superfamily)